LGTGVSKLSEIRTSALAGRLAAKSARERSDPCVMMEIDGRVFTKDNARLSF